MAKPDWEAIESAYRAGVLSLREIGTEYGVTEGAIRKRAKKYGWVRSENTGTQNGTQVRKNGTQKKVVRTKQSPDGSGVSKKYAEKKSEPPPNTKPIRGSRTAPPVNPFPPGNQAALKHGAYARRLLWSDEVNEDAQALTLRDELIRLRAANLIAAENIGRWTVQIEDAEVDEVKPLTEKIAAADKGMMRNTVRIESIERSLAAIGKSSADTDYRHAATEKVSLEADRLKREAGDPNTHGPRGLNDFYADIETDAQSGAATVLDNEGEE
ncbi:conserved hypothetical protein [Enterobacterales bacterium 8AC]|nr:conserved hypothetical protein [Enterobacterales bacterium 8AC]